MRPARRRSSPGSSARRRARGPNSRRAAPAGRPFALSEEGASDVVASCARPSRRGSCCATRRRRVEARRCRPATAVTVHQPVRSRCTFVPVTVHGPSAVNDSGRPDDTLGWDREVADRRASSPAIGSKVIVWVSSVGHVAGPIAAGGADLDVSDWAAPPTRPQRGSSRARAPRRRRGCRSPAPASSRPRPGGRTA